MSAWSTPSPFFVDTALADNAYAVEAEPGLHFVLRKWIEGEFEDGRSLSIYRPDRLQDW